ncbi:MAG: hypothetical protein ABI548_24475 [Polyangiaceae bacterium]
MAQQVHRELDEKLNDLSDRNAFWGPLLSFRPEKEQCIGVSRALLLTSVVGVFYGMLLNVMLALICRHARHMPPVYGAPLMLTFTYFVAFQLSLAPAWNRRARLLVRRAGYMQSISRTGE